MEHGKIVKPLRTSETPFCQAKGMLFLHQNTFDAEAFREVT